MYEGIPTSGQSQNIKSGMSSISASLFDFVYANLYSLVNRGRFLLKRELGGWSSQ